MVEPRRLLILGGTAEARALAEHAVKWPELEIINSLAGRTEAPKRPAGQLRVGGFGGVQGLTEFLTGKRIDFVVDATHPFAINISRNAAEACSTLAMRRLKLVRPPWEKQTGDNWIDVDSAEQAAAQLRRLGTRVFLTLGSQQLAAFAYLTDIWFLVRTIDPPEKSLPLANATLITGRGPFSLEEEKRLLDVHRIEGIVTRNSGGRATYAKIAAARAAGLWVVMIRRPAPPQGDRVDSVAAAVDWIGQRIDSV